MDPKGDGASAAEEDPATPLDASGPGWPGSASHQPASSQVSSGKADEVLDDELDALLDDALGDFDKPPPLPPSGSGALDAATYLKNINSRNAAPLPKFTSKDDSQKAVDEMNMNSVWSEEFIREATAQFEKNMRELLGQAAAASPGSSSSPSKGDTGDSLHKVIEAATSAALSGSGTTASPDGIAASLNEAIKNIQQQTSTLENPMPLSDDDLSKLMGSLGMGMGEGEVDEAEMNAFLPFMTNMMQKLLSKELLHPVLTDLVDRYPDWLADNREKISSVQYEKYNQQYEYMRRICQEYAQEKETDSDDVKSKRFDRISDLMLKVQYIGPPPSELVGEMDQNGLATLDPSMASQCSIM